MKFRALDTEAPEVKAALVPVRRLTVPAQVRPDAALPIGQWLGWEIQKRIRVATVLHSDTGGLTTVDPTNSDPFMLLTTRGIRDNIARGVIYLENPWHLMELLADQFASIGRNDISGTLRDLTSRK